MIIYRDSIMTGKSNMMDLDVTSEQLDEWEAGGLIQNVMPNLTPTEREFLMTGMSEEEQEKYYE